MKQTRQKNRLWLVIPLSVILMGLVIAFGRHSVMADWRTASRESTGVAPDPAVTADMPVTPADGADTPPGSPQRVALAPAASRGESATHASETPGAMQFLGTDLDKLLDQFRDRSPEQIATLLSLMEMQTRQNIVSMLSKSGGLVVFSARELGLEGNPVLQERLSAASEVADAQPETE